MSMTLQEKFINLSNSNKKSDRFYAQFLGLPENVSNILGRQLKMIGRPEINFASEIVRRRGYTYKDKQEVTFEPISASFFDDENSITSMLLYAQVFRQINKYPDVFGQTDAGDERDYRFDIKVDYYNSIGEKTETIILRDCFISSLAHGDTMYSTDEDKELTVTIEFDNLDIPTFDEFSKVLKRA